jgi:hypothetical protein
MPVALTLEQKKERAMQRLNHSVEEVIKPSSDGSMRKKKNVFNGTRTKLSVQKQIPGYHLHIMNDLSGRIEQALENGYDFVSPEEVGGVETNVVSRNGDITGSRVRWTVGATEDGQPLYAYLMKIKQEWYDEDQADLQAKNDMIDSEIFKAKTGEFYGQGKKEKL